MGNLNLKTFWSFERFRRAVVDGVLAWECSVTLLNTALAEPRKRNLPALHRLHSGKWGKHGGPPCFFSQLPPANNDRRALLDYESTIESKLHFKLCFLSFFALFQLHCSEFSGDGFQHRIKFCLRFNCQHSLICTLITFFSVGKDDDTVQLYTFSRVLAVTRSRSRSLSDEIFHHTLMCPPYTYSYSMGEM